jgi:hypothetical protein
LQAQYLELQDIMAVVVLAAEKLMVQVAKVVAVVQDNQERQALEVAVEVELQLLVQG